MAMRALLSAVAMVVGVSAASVGVPVGFSVGAAHAEPTSPSPTNTSSDDELTDMVMDAIQGDDATPATTTVPAPPG